MASSFNSSFSSLLEPLAPSAANEDAMAKRLQNVRDGYDEILSLLDAIDRLVQRFIVEPTVADMEGTQSALSNKTQIGGPSF